MKKRIYLAMMLFAVVSLMTVSCKKNPITIGITLNKTSLNMEEGSIETLTATVWSDKAADEVVTWSSDNSTIAIVDATGEVTALKIGNATITAKTKNGKTATCKVKVSCASVQLWENGPYWATKNIGADKPKDRGYYFAWGYAEGCVRNSDNDAWVLASDGTTVRTFGNRDEVSTDFHHRFLFFFEDAATAAWGYDWRIPTKEEFVKLTSDIYTTWTYIHSNGVHGYRVTGKDAYADKVIFLPLTGLGLEDKIDFIDFEMITNYGCYWSTTVASKDAENKAWCLLIDSNGYKDIFEDEYMSHGMCVRAVRASAL